MKQTMLTPGKFAEKLRQLHITRTPYLFDYVGEYTYTGCSEILEQSEDYYAVYIYKTEIDLLKSIILNLEKLDLADGSDDDFFDGDPAIMEAVIQGLYLLQLINNPKLDLAKAYDALQKVFQHYWESRESGQIEIEDMDDVYKDYESKIDYENHQILNLDGFVINQIITQ